MLENIRCGRMLTSVLHVVQNELEQPRLEALTGREASRGIRRDFLDALGWQLESEGELILIPADQRNSLGTRSTDLDDELRQRLAGELVQEATPERSQRHITFLRENFADLLNDGLGWSRGRS
ncbi:MAG: hypothetical protein ABL998_02520 [Planctomycetota bacterium]